MPGSANLPKELVTPRRRRVATATQDHVIASSIALDSSGSRCGASSPRRARRAGGGRAALAAIVVGGERGTPVAKRLTSEHTSTSASRVPAPTTPADLTAALSRPSVRHHAAPRRASHTPRRQAAHKAHFGLAAERQPAHHIVAEFDDNCHACRSDLDPDRPAQHRRPAAHSRGGRGHDDWLRIKRGLRSGQPPRVWDQRNTWTGVSTW